VTITFDRVGSCPAMAVVIVEGYTPANGLAHGSLDVTVRACDACHHTVRDQMDACGMTPYTVQPRSVARCGDRTVFQPSRYTEAHPA
jgi:hypothetical protein